MGVRMRINNINKILDIVRKSNIRGVDLQYIESVLEVELSRVNLAKIKLKEFHRKRYLENKEKSK